MFEGPIPISKTNLINHPRNPGIQTLVHSGVHITRNGSQEAVPEAQQHAGRPQDRRHREVVVFILRFV